MIFNSNIYDKSTIQKNQYFNQDLVKSILNYKFDRNYLLQYYIDNNDYKEINWKILSNETFSDHDKNKIILTDGYVVKNNEIYKISFSNNTDNDELLTNNPFVNNITCLNIERSDIDNNKILVNNHIIDNNKFPLYMNIWSYIVLDINNIDNVKFELWDEGTFERDDNKLIVGYVKFKFHSISKYNLEIIEVTQNKPKHSLYSLDIFRDYNSIRYFYDGLNNYIRNHHIKGYKDRKISNINVFNLFEHDYDYKLHNKIDYKTSFLNNNLLLSQQVEDKVWFYKGKNDQYDSGYFAHIVNEWAHHIENSKLMIVEDYEHRKEEQDLKAKRSKTKFSVDLLSQDLSLYDFNDGKNVIDGKLPKFIVNRFILDHNTIHLLNDYRNIENNIPYYFKNIKYNLRIQKPLEIRNSDKVRYVYGALFYNDKIFTDLFDITKEDFYSFYENKNFTILNQITHIRYNNTMTKLNNYKRLYFKILGYDENKHLVDVSNDDVTINDYIITLDILSLSKL